MNCSNKHCSNKHTEETEEEEEEEEEDSYSTIPPRSLGFYPAFLIRNSAQEHSNFLHTLTDTRWELPEYSEYERAVCASDPPIACDMMRSSDNSNIMVYNTLCASSAASTSSCAEHPEYQQHIQNTLPAECAIKHGKPVVRSRLGALRRHFTPLCQQRPTIPAACELKHGTLHGHRGQSVTDLKTRGTVSSVQSGFWKKTNSIFRGVLTQEDTENIPALGLDVHDIGGHCLEFSITEQGWMYLHRARLTSDCKQIGGHVAFFLQVEGFARV